MTALGFPRISFGIIVLNGEPFTRYCLRAIYPFAYEIIVVEGACRAASAIATKDGHSKDGTLESLYRYKAEEDPEDKIRILTRDGFWNEKDEQSMAYTRIATGDYIWQVDIDEFYHPGAMQTVLEMLREDPHITGVSFKQISFWGGFEYVVDSLYLRQGADIFHRLFRWNEGFRYITHRPPTVYDTQGRDLQSIKWINGYELERKGILLYHYALVFPKQVLDKCHYYSQAEWASHARSSLDWAQNNFLRMGNPFRVHNVYAYPSWLERFQGTHPPQVQQLVSDIKTGLIDINVRSNEDIEEILHSRRYRLGRFVLKRRLFQKVFKYFRRVKEIIEKIK